MLKRLAARTSLRSRRLKLRLFISSARKTGKAIDLFPDRKAAEAMLAACLADEPGWVGELSVERVELDAGSLN